MSKLISRASKQIFGTRRMAGRYIWRGEHWTATATVPQGDATRHWSCGSTTPTGRPWALLCHRSQGRRTTARSRFPAS